VEQQLEEELDAALEDVYRDAEVALSEHAANAQQRKKQAARRATEAWLAGQSAQQRAAYLARVGYTHGEAA
jgi:hypothetical protein